MKIRIIKLIEHKKPDVLVVNSKQTYLLSPWLMEPGGLMPHSQGLSNIPYPDPNQPNSSYICYIFVISVSSSSIQMLSPISV